MPIASAGHKERYLTLDGLRGVAAIAVMIYHRRTWSTDGHWFEHAHLAVDFFFLLSGFVIAHAYERRLLTRMSMREFLRVRLIRLYPLIVLGTLLGAAYAFTDAHIRGDRQALHELWMTLPLALLLLPASKSLGAEPFTIDPPAWSLFYELLINLCYACVVRLLNTFTLVLMIALSLPAEIAGAYHFGSLGPIGNQFDTLLAALPRTMLPFFSGVLLYRLHGQGRLPRFSAGIAPLSLLLLLSFLPTFLHHPQPLYDIACVGVLHPLIIVLGCQANPSGKAAKAAAALAELSFPIYVLHFPLFYWFAFVAEKLGCKDGAPAPWYLFAAVNVVIAISYMLLRTYDIPVRRRITDYYRRGGKSSRAQSSAWVRE